MDDWLRLHAGSYSITAFGHDLLLVDGVSPVLNTAYWSLGWEIVYSLVVPLVIFGLRPVRSLTLATTLAVVLAASIVFGTRGTGRSTAFHTLWSASRYLPMFLLGALAAQLADQIRPLIHWAQQRRFAIAALWTLTLAALLWPLSWKTAHILPSLHDAISACGALLLVVLFAFSSSGQRIGQSQLPAWLGQRSFSIYLVHGPIVIGVAYLVYPHGLPWVMLVTALPLSIAAGALFFVLFERPLHRVSRNLGKRAWGEFSGTQETAAEST
jgi:peptidoglycan/LPS O-acetylase OafA/YrhL